MSLYELIVGLFLGAIALAGSIEAISSLNRHIKKGNEQTLHLAGVATVASLALLIEDDIDSHRLEVRYRIHKKGGISYTNGVKNRAIETPQDSITTLRLRFHEFLSLKDISGTFPSFSAVGCSLFSPSQASNFPLSWIALNDSKIFEVITEQSTPWSKGCRLLKLRLSQSMIASSDVVEPRTLSFLFPIHRLGTYFWDKQNQLRYIGHKGRENIENQPVTSSLPHLSWELESLKSLTPSAKINLSLYKKNFTSYSIQSRLSALPHWSIPLLLTQGAND